ncbi:MAG: carbamoyltransferase [Bacteroidota bacterium]
MNILGISAYYHDSAAALVSDGQIIAAAQEERFSRKKHDARFPKNAIAYCLKEANLTLLEIDNIVFYDKPLVKFERLLETYLSYAPKGFQSFLMAMPIWLKEKLFLKRLLRTQLQAVQAYDSTKLNLLFSEHHLSHAASTFFPSPFQEAAILTIDGVGEWATASLAFGKANTIKVIKELHFPHSLGLLYSAFTYFLGFAVNGGEYKMMGLAPYGNPDANAVKAYKKIILDELIDLKEDGSLWLNQRYFDYATGLRMVKNRQWEALFGFPRRERKAAIQQQHCNLALAVQQVTETVVLRMAKELKRYTNAKYLCLAGGVALNCVANGKLLASNIFDDIFVQPAAGDAGGALGAALAANYIFHKKERITVPTISTQSTYLGPTFEQNYIQRLLQNLNHPFDYFDNFELLCQKVSQQIADGKVVGWFQGRMEFGPRALGNRSILADPRNENMQKILNLAIKNRESFRPFAPAVLAEDAAIFFEVDRPSPFMTMVTTVKPSYQKELPNDYQERPIFDKLAVARSDFPAVTHVDFSARIQTVSRTDNLRFWQLLQAFKKETGCGMLINTSFNVKDEPIVCTPTDAYRCFMKTEMDVLVIGDFVIEKR